MSDAAMWVDLYEAQRQPGDHAGSGACGHAALHCHVGPEAPEFRVPFAVNDRTDVGSLFDWLMSQVHPQSDAAPWPSVRVELAKRNDGSLE